MRTTDYAPSVPHRDVTDRGGRVYRIGESAGDIMGRGRPWMVVLPWLGTVGVAAAGYAFAAAGGAPHGARPWDGGHVFRLLGVWVCCQAAVAFPAGWLRENGRLPARVATPLGALATVAGGLLVAYAPDTPAVRTGFAVLGGIGAGLVRASCVPLAGKWYPERGGGPTALVDGGLVQGAVPLVFLCTPYADPSGHRTSLVAAGAALCLMVAAVGRRFEDPPENWWPATADPPRTLAGRAARRASSRNPLAVRQHGPREAVRTPALWLLWCCLLCASGVALFGAAVQVPFGVDMGFAGGTVAAALCLGALVNGVGPGAVGRLSDRWGRRGTLIAVCVALGTAQFGVLVAGRSGSLASFLVCSLVSVLAGGAVFPLLAAVTADHFGENHNAANHGLVQSSTLVAGVVGAALCASVVGARDYYGAFLLAGSLGLAAAVLTFFLHSPDRSKVRRIVPNPQPLGEEMA